MYAVRFLNFDMTKYFDSYEEALQYGLKTSFEFAIYNMGKTL